MAERGTLLERADVLDAMAGLAENAAEGTGTAVSLVAPAGTGKTSVLEAAKTAFRAAGLRVLSARGVEQEQQLPHGVTRSLLDPALSEESVRDEVLVDAAGPARVLFDGSHGAEAVPLQHALYWTVAGLARTSPTALVLDDAHVADQASLEFLAHLARRVTDLPVLLVVAARPQEQAPWTPSLTGLVDAARAQPLLPLSLEGVTALVTDALGPDRGEGLAEACLRATGGNAFYLTELLADLQRRTADVTLDAVASTAPPAIVRSVLLRIGALGAAATELARSVGILSEPSRLHAAAQLAGIDLDTAARTADALTLAGVLGPGDGLRFAHPILRAAVLGDLGDHDRSQRHRRAAALLRETGSGVALVATHLLQTEPAGDPAAAAALIAAGRDALRSGSSDAAVVMLRRAWEEPPPAEDRDSCLFELGLAEAGIGDFAALEHLTRAIENAPDDSTRAERAVIFAELARKVDLVPAGLDALDSALDGSPEPEIAMVAQLQRYWAGRTTVQTLDRVRDERLELDRAYASPFPRVRRMAAVYLAMEAAIAGTDRSTWIADAHSEPGLLSFVAADSGEVAGALFTLILTEDHELFDAFSRELFQAAGRAGNWVAHVVASIYRSTELLRLGRYAEAEEEVLSANALAAEHGWHQSTPELVGILASAHLGRGDREGAAAVLTGCAFDLDAPLTTYPTALLLGARGQLRLADGAAQGALEDFTRVGECLEYLGLHSAAVLPWRAQRAAALRLLGRLDEAIEAAADELAWARNGGPATRAGALRVVASTSTGEQAITLLREAEALISEDLCLVERARVAADLGAALRRAGRMREARIPLATALDLATRIGAAPLAERAREEILAAGGRPRRTVLTGPGALTASELRVVRLAAGGMTNSVIAQTLFVSTKTVEKHLGNAYGKLGISSRAELTGVDLG